jgi:hypothetical protein
MRERALPLVWAGLRRFDLRGIEAGVRLLVPPLAELGAACVALLGVAAAGRISGLLPHSGAWLAVGGGCLAALLVYILGGLRVAGAPRAAYAALAMAPAYAVWKLGRAAVRPLLRRGRRTGTADAWVRTERLPVALAVERTEP